MKKLAIVIPTYNSSKFLPTFFASIKRQNCELDVEVVVADNGSTDETKKIALEQGAKFIDVCGPPPQVNKQRNEGAYATDADFFYFLDHDMELSPGLLDEIYRFIQEEKYQALYVSERIKTANSFLTKVRNFERSAYQGTDIDGIRVVSRQLFESVGGFDEKLSHGPGDWDFDIRVKKKFPNIALTKEYVVHYENFLNLWAYISKRSNYSKGIQDYIAKWSGDREGQIALDNQFNIYSRAIKLFFGRESYKKTLRQIHLYFSFLGIKALIYIMYRLKGGR